MKGVGNIEKKNCYVKLMKKKTVYVLTDSCLNKTRLRAKQIFKLLISSFKNYNIRMKERRSRKWLEELHHNGSLFLL